MGLPSLWLHRRLVLPVCLKAVFTHLQLVLSPLLPLSLPHWEIRSRALTPEQGCLSAPFGDGFLHWFLYITKLLVCQLSSWTDSLGSGRCCLFSASESHLLIPFLLFPKFYNDSLKSFHFRWLQQEGSFTPDAFQCRSDLFISVLGFSSQMAKTLRPFSIPVGELKGYL